MTVFTDDRQLEWDGLVVTVEEQQKVIVLDRTAAPVALIHGLTEEIDAETAGKTLRPLLIGHFGAVRLDPVDVLVVRAGDGLALEEVLPMENGMVAPQGDDALSEGQKLAVGIGQIPVNPADFVILTVGVVAPLLGCLLYTSRCV